MSTTSPRSAFLEATRSLLLAPRFTAALTTVSITAAFFSNILRDIIGWPGLIAILVGLVAFAVASLVARREELEWRGILPISLIVFVGWTLVSIFWSQYQWSTLGGIAYQLVFTVLGVVIALSRDAIQIVRAFGDALRFVIGVSLGLEVLSGILIDTPIRFLGIEGNITSFGPIQGVMGTRNQMGLTALIALVTFGTELLTRSIARSTGIVSLAAAAFAIFLSQSPVSIATLIVLGIASFALLGLRRLSPGARRFAQFGFLLVTVVLIVVGYIFRLRILTLLDARSEFGYRVNIWKQVQTLIRVHNLEGWGWVGAWHPELQPFRKIELLHAAHPQSALNAYIDTWFQLGIVGLLCFFVLIGLAFGRSWLLASQHRSRAYVWPALVLLAVLVTSLAESVALVEYGWLIVVVAAVKASEKLSWRRQLAD
jgi:O-antigen ligase